MSVHSLPGIPSTFRRSNCWEVPQLAQICDMKFPVQALSVVMINKLGRPSIQPEPNLRVSVRRFLATDVRRTNTLRLADETGRCYHKQDVTCGWLTIRSRRTLPFLQAYLHNHCKGKQQSCSKFGDLDTECLTRYSSTSIIRLVR